MVKIVPLRPSGGGARPSLPIFAPNPLILSQFPKNQQVAPQFSAPRGYFQPLRGVPLADGARPLPAGTAKNGKKRLFVNPSKCFPRIFGDPNAKKATFCNKTALDMHKVLRTPPPSVGVGMRDDFAFKGLFYGLAGLRGTPLLAAASRL